MQVGLNTRDPYHMVYAGQKGSLVNMDLTTNNILVGPDEGSLFSGNPDCFILGPLNSGYADGTRDLWAIALTGNPVVAFMEGLQNWQPSPAQIQEQLNALGLATEATQQQVSAHTSSTATNVATVNTTLGTPAQKSDVNQVNSTLGTPAQTADIGNLHAPGQTVANEVSTTGVPLLSKSSTLHHSPSTAIPANSSTNAGSPYVITQIGYEISIGLSTIPSATIPGAAVTLTWTDSVSGDIVAVEQWMLAAGSSAFQQYIGTGPTKGDTLTLNIANLDAAQVLTYTLTISQNSRVYTRDDWRQQTNVTVPGQTQATYRQAANVLFSTNPSLGSLIAAQRILPLYAGDILLSVQNGANAGTLVAITAFLDSSLAQFTLWESGALAANANFSQKISLPRESCQLFIQNGSGTTQSIAVQGVISEQIS